MILHVLIAMMAGWINRHQQHVIAYLQEENRVLKAQRGQRRLRGVRVRGLAVVDVRDAADHRHKRVAVQLG